MHATNNDTDTEHQHDICDPIFGVCIIVQLLMRDNDVNFCNRSILLPQNLQAVGCDTEEHEHIVALEVGQVVIEARCHT